MAFAIALMLGLTGFFVRERFRAHRHRLGSDAPLLAKLEADLAELRHQRRLLLNVGTWYLAPCIAAAAVVAGTAIVHAPVVLSAKLLAGAIMLVLLALTCWGVWALNRWAVRKCLNPGSKNSKGCTRAFGRNRNHSVACRAGSPNPALQCGARSVTRPQAPPPNLHRSHFPMNTQSLIVAWKILRNALGVAFPLALTSLCPAATPDVQTLIDTWNQDKPGGVAVAWVDENGVQFFQTGHFAKTDDRPVTPDTQFEIGSDHQGFHGPAAGRERARGQGEPRRSGHEIPEGPGEPRKDGRGWTRSRS